jgi:hypothetical protein
MSLKINNMCKKKECVSLVKIEFKSNLNRMRLLLNEFEDLNLNTNVIY